MLGRAVGVALVVHAVVRRQHNHRPQRVQLGQALVQRRVKGVRLRRAWRMRVLHEICERQIQHIRQPLAHQVHAAGHHKVAHPARVNVRVLPPHAPRDTRNPMLLLGRLVRQLAGKANAAPARSQHGAQLVLGRNGRYAPAVLAIPGEQRLAAQKARVVHHHLHVALGVVEVIAGNAVRRGRPAGRDGHVVRIGERWNRRRDQVIRALPLKAGHRRHAPMLDRRVHVCRLRTVRANHHHRRPDFSHRQPPRQPSNPRPV